MTISRTQLFFMIIKTQIGIGLLSLPSDTQSIAGGDSWISVLLAGAVIQLVLFVYWHLLKKYPNDTLSEITIHLLGRYLGKAINVVYYAFFVLIAAYACSLYAELINIWMLPLTPGWVLLLLIVGTSVYLALDNLRVIARFFVFSSILFVVLILISFLNFNSVMHISNILPVGQSGMMPILSGSEKTFFSMLGFEVTLYFYSQVQGNRKGMLSVISAANGFVTLFYTYFVLICLMGLSPKALEQVNEPVLFLFKGLSFQLFDRLDLIFLTIWIIPMTATIVSYLCVAGKSLTTKRGSYRKLVWFSGGIVFITAWFITTIENMRPFSKWLEYGYLIMIAAVPVLLWLSSFLVKTHEKVGSV
ncbi:GerAB/ArcD/ProY family transporter [Paenibacillus sp. BC26]|uniref:GerAB/ArcD/ProY family transporter n=1 Tax=Paenibacillus sp. BC26 TaxID=1881032 RepID=UPI00210E4980|nr:GerAB/ArcD/ProY family transporter [Paenibacillus sp. BC26]